MIHLTEKGKENLRVQGRELSDKLVGMVHEGHYRKVVILDEDGKPFLEFPLLLGVVVTLLLPIVVGFVLLLFLMSGWHAVVEKRKK